MITDPLPIPFSEICSPSHMINAVPVVRVSMVRSRKPQPGSGTRIAPVWLRILSRPTAIPNDCTSERPMVP
jgi:hypothetical protein